MTDYTDRHFFQTYSYIRSRYLFSNHVHHVRGQTFIHSVKKGLRHGSEGRENDVIKVSEFVLS